MNEIKFELGPIQKQWIADLRAYPERQMAGCLGEKHNGVLTLCCLGQALVTMNAMTNKENCFIGNSLANTIEDDNDQLGIFTNYLDLGLNSARGTHRVLAYNDETYSSLVGANDAGVPWSVIADTIEENAHLIFTEPK